MSRNAARAALLRALDELDSASDELGREPERVDLVVIYTAGYDGEDGWHEVGGWSSTPGPKWMHVALLQRAADAQADAIYSADDEEEDD